MLPRVKLRPTLANNDVPRDDILVYEIIEDSGMLLKRERNHT